ncbi:MAG: methionine adenosyltransferase [Candidatus Woesearchaeota archaeon]
MNIQTCESVSRGHPDKVCDQISDAILDAYLQKDENAKVAVETLMTGNTCILAGEVSSNIILDFEDIVKSVLRDIGYTDKKYGLDSDQITLLNLIRKQSPEINQGVESGGAGDQGIMYGYATDETPELLPLPYVLARKIIIALDTERKQDKNLGPDAKSQVTVQDGKATHIVVAQQHVQGDITKQITDIVRQTIPEYITANTKIIVNGCGTFLLGGPGVDCGLTGRKTQVDTYGGIVPHGGGAFSGKDPSKVDRSAAYYARHVACQEVRKRGGSCLVSVSYVIGKSEPCHVSVSGYDFRPQSISKSLRLSKQKYYETAQFGHFGRGFSWD